MYANPTSVSTTTQLSQDLVKMLFLIFSFWSLEVYGFEVSFYFFSFRLPVHKYSSGGEEKNKTKKKEI